MPYSVRPMAVYDIARVLAVIYLNWLDSRYSDMAFDHASAMQTLESTLDSDLSQVFVVEIDGLVVGAIGAVVVKMPWFKEKFAYEQILTIHPEHRGYRQSMLLLRAYKDWAKKSGASVLNVLVDHGKHDERVARLYERAGFRRNGVSLAMRT